MATNIEITAQLNKMIAEQNQLLLVQAKIQKSQLALTQAMAEAMGNVDVSAMSDSLKAVTEQLNAAEEAAKRVGQTTQGAAAETVTSQIRARTEINNTADALQKAADEAAKFNIAAAAVEGAIRGFQLSFNIVTSLVGILGQAARGVGQFAMSVLRFPLSIWNFLFEKATSGGGGGELRQTLENIRKEFGDLSKSSSKAIIDMAKSMKGELANTGLSVYRTFGNLAERLKTVLELAKALGPLFINVVQRGLIKSAEATLAFQKGLGLSNEQMKTLARTALIRGTSIDESLREMSNYAIQLGEAFGMNAMEISRDMAELEGDMKHFGGLTRKELGETVVYAKRLGIEVKSLAGIMDTFDTFDTAADAAARLNQQFGIQVDAMRLMKAESPAQRLEELRKGLERTGRSFESLDRRSQQYLATTVGMSQEEAALAFAQANRGMSLDQIKKKSAEAEKKQLTQAEALQKLAGSIERLVKSGGGGVKSLFEAFVDGFQRAIFRSREFRQIMRNIRIMLRQTRIAGMQVGRAFLDMMPGFKGILTALGDLFNPTRWKNTLNKVVDAFKSFFKDLQTNPEAGLKNLFDRLKKAFFDHFDASSGAGRKLIENFKLFFGTVLKAVIGGLNALIPMAFEALTKLFKGINGFLKGEIGIPIDTDSISGQIMEVLSPLWETIKEAWPPLWEAMKELFTTVFNKLSDWYEQNRMLIWGFIFGPAVIKSLISGMSAAIGQAMVKGVTGGLTSTLVKTTVTRTASTVIPSLINGAGVTATAGAGAAQAASGAAAGAGGAAAITSAIPVFAALTLLIPVIAAMMVAAVVMLGNFSIAQVGVTVAAMAAGELLLLGMVGLVLAVGAVGYALSASLGTGVLAAAAGLVVLGGMIFGLSYVMKEAILKFSKIDSADITKAVVALEAGEVLLFGAAGLVGAAAIVGLLIPVAPLLIAGFLALGLIVFGVADMIKNIIISIRNIPDLGAGFETKLGAFLGVFEAVTDFMRVLNDIMISSAIITLIRTSPLGILMNLLTGANSPFQELSTFVSTFGPVIQTLVTSVIANTAGLTKERIKALEVLAPVIEAIGTLIQAMQPPTNIALIGSVMPLGTIVTLTTYFEGIKNMLTGDGGLVNSVLGIIQSIGDIPATTFNVEAIRAFTSIIGGLGTFIGSFAELTETGVLDTLLDERSRLISGPVATFFLAFGNTKAAANALEDPAVKRLNGIVTFMKNMILGLKESGIVEMINVIINNASGALRGLTKEQISGIAPITSMISSIFSFVGQIGENFKVDPDVAKAISEGTSQEGIEAAKNAVLNLPANLASNINTIINSIRENIAPIIRTLTGSIASFSAADVKKASEAGQAIMSIISGISSFMTSIKELGTTEITQAMEDGSTVTATIFDTDRISQMIKTMNDIVGAVFSGENSGMIKTIVDSLLGSGITRLPRGIGEKAKAIVDILGLISVVAEPEFQKNIKNLSSGVTGSTVISGIITNAADVIKGIVSGLGNMFDNSDFKNGIKQFTKGNIGKLENIQGILTQVNNVVNGISIDLSVGTTVAASNLAGMKSNIELIVQEANSIFDTINRINDFNVPTTLQKLGNYLGLGGNNTITLKNENVSINVTVDVHIDARELERVLLERPRTRFQAKAAPGTAGGE